MTTGHGDPLGSLTIRDRNGARRVRLADYLDAATEEAAAAAAHAWIKTLRGLLVEGQPFRRRFHIRGDSLWWFAELYLHKQQVVLHLHRAVMALERLILDRAANRPDAARGFPCGARDGPVDRRQPRRPLARTWRRGAAAAASRPARRTGPPAAPRIARLETASPPERSARRSDGRDCGLRPFGVLDPRRRRRGGRGLHRPGARGDRGPGSRGAAAGRRRAGRQLPRPALVASAARDDGGRGGRSDRVVRRSRCVRGLGGRVARSAHLPAGDLEQPRHPAARRHRRRRLRAGRARASWRGSRCCSGRGRRAPWTRPARRSTRCARRRR